MSLAWHLDIFILPSNEKSDFHVIIVAVSNQWRIWKPATEDFMLVSTSFLSMQSQPLKNVSQKS